MGTLIITIYVAGFRLKLVIGVDLQRHGISAYLSAFSYNNSEQCADDNLVLGVSYSNITMI